MKFIKMNPEKLFFCLICSGLQPSTNESTAVAKFYLTPVSIPVLI